MDFRKIEWTDEVILDFWRYWSTRPDEYFSESFGDTIIRFTKDHSGPIGKALDFGAGTGGLLKALSRHNIHCWGLDFGQDAIDALSARFADDQKVVQIFSPDQVSVYGNSFDTVFLIETIEHMPDRHLIPSLNNVFAMLKSGGTLVISTPNDEDLSAAEVYCPVSQLVFHPMQHLRSWTAETLTEYLVPFGYSNIECLEMDLQALPYHSKSATFKRFLKRFLNTRHKDPHLVTFARKAIT